MQNLVMDYRPSLTAENLSRLAFSCLQSCLLGTLSGSAFETAIAQTNPRLVSVVMFGFSAMVFRWSRNITSEFLAIEGSLPGLPRRFLRHFYALQCLMWGVGYYLHLFRDGDTYGHVPTVWVWLHGAALGVLATLSYADITRANAPSLQTRAGVLF